MATLTTNKNYLNPTGFRLAIDSTLYPNTEYFCSAVSHPDVFVGEGTLNIPGLNSFIPGDAVSYGTLTVSIIIDEDMTSYTEMVECLKSVVTSSISVTRDITLQVLSSHSNVSKSIRYKDAFPTNIAQLAFTASAEEYLTFDVSFRYSEFLFE
mgnify:FL=1